MDRGGRTGEIDVESLLPSYLEATREGSQQYWLSPDNSIFRTPSILARHNEKAYIPNYFSIGPFHHGQTKLKGGERIKIKYVEEVLSRAENTRRKEILDSIRKVENRARNCYAENLENKNFAEMLVFDGCFIIELFRKYDDVAAGENVAAREADDPIFSQACMLQFLHHDLILLENQIPWFVLEILFEKTRDTYHEKKSLKELAFGFFSNNFISRTPKFDPILSQNVKHILDMLRLILVLSSEEVEKYDRKPQFNQTWKWKSIPRATRLEEAGVRFVQVNPHSILDLKSMNDALEIPSLLIQETTETIFRNLISYEQCLPNCRPIITSYAKIMDNLIDTTNDVEILCKKGILHNWLSPEDATQLFNKLCIDTNLKEFYYGQLCDEVNCLYEKVQPRWRVALIKDYITKPWAIVAIVYALFMFALTFAQTIKKG